MNVITTLLQLSIYASAMITAVLAIKAIFKDKINLKIVIMLWTLILLRLIIPLTVSSPIHFDSFLVDENAAPITENEAADTHADEANESEYAPTASAMPTIVYDGESADSKEYSVSEEKVQPSFYDKVSAYVKSVNMITYFALVWLAGALILLIRNVIYYLNFNKLIKDCQPINSSEIGDMIDVVKDTLDIKEDIKVITCRFVDSPVTFRLHKPVVILPVRFMSRISKEKLNMVLLHEFCHIKRKDIFFNMLWMAAKTIHWFNPFVWIAYNNYMEDVELSVDEMVNSYLSEELKFVYSQSLIDVIRFSKNIVKLPVAMSFCQDKSKLRKRVENMLKPKKKLKSAGGISLLLAVVMIFTCFTTACQPTPQDLVVENKNDGELEAAIMETAAPSETQADTQEISEGSQASANEIRIVDTASNDTGTISVDINAKVVTAGDEKVTIARMENYYLTEDEMEQMSKIFFGGDVKYYDHLTATKSQWEENIIFLQQRLTLDDDELLDMYADKELYTIEEIKAHINNVIEEIKGYAAAAPEYGEEIEFEVRSEEWGGFYANVEYGGEHMGYVSYSEPFAGRVSFSCYMEKGKSTDAGIIPAASTITMGVDLSSENAAEAAQNALNLIDSLGIEGVELGDVYMSSGNELTSQGENVSTGDESYVFCFERTVGERTVDHSFYDGGYISDDEVAQTVPYERLEVWTKGSEISKFIWKNPHRITETINENAAVQISYEQAMDLAIKQLITKYTYESYGNIMVQISGIEFEMIRMKEKNSSKYITVPAWKIYGDVVKMRTQEELDALRDIMEKDPHEVFDLSEYISLTQRDGPNIVTVNALDGTIVDMDKAY